MILTHTQTLQGQAALLVCGHGVNFLHFGRSYEVNEKFKICFIFNYVPVSVWRYYMSVVASHQRRLGCAGAGAMGVAEPSHMDLGN